MSGIKLNSSEGRWIMAAATLASSMAFIDGTALNVVLPTLQKSLHASGGDLFWILNAYLLMLAALMLVGGSVGDRFGHKRAFLCGVILFTLGSAACGFSAGALHLIICRAVQGAGGAFMIPGSLSLISSSINEEERGKAIGQWSSLTTLVMMGGPVLGGALADAGLWRYIFFINLPIGVVAVLILWRKISEPLRPAPAPPADVKGAISIAISLACLTFGLLNLGSAVNNPQKSWSFIGIGILLLLLFIRLEKRSAHPMMPLGLFANRVFSGANLLSFFLYAALGSAMLFLSLNLVQVQGYSQLQSGMAFLPFTLSVLVFAGIAGKMADRNGFQIFLVAGPAVAAGGMLLLSLVGQTSGPGAYWTTFLPGMIVFGLGMAFTVSPLTSAVMGAIAEEYSGVASGVNNAVTRIANVLAYAVFGALAFVFFSGHLEQELKPLSLSQTEQRSVMKEAVNLGNAQLPLVVTGVKGAMVKTAYRDSFIHVYQTILRISAALAFTAALIALMMIGDDKKGRTDQVNPH